MARELPRAEPVAVAFVASTLVTGGAERQVAHLLLHLSAGSFRPRVYLLREPGAVGDELAARGVPVLSRLAPGRPPSPVALLAFVRRLRADRIRLLYCLDHTNAVVTATIASRIVRRLPVLLAVHTTGQWEKASLPPPVRASLGGIARVLAVAEAQKRYLVESEGIPAGRITVIRNGIPPLDPAALPSRDAARASLGIAPGDGPVAGIVAMLRPEKAHENFLAAARAVLDRHPRAVFLLVGDGPRRAELESLAAGLGLGERARFLGLRADVPRILPALDLSVLASHPRVETLPLSQLEAMSLGIPVVATRVGALDEMVTDGVEGRLVAPGSAEALAAAMLDVLADPERARRMGLAARERVARDYSIERVVRETEELMREAIGGGA